MIQGWQFTEEAIMEEVIIEVILAHASLGSVTVQLFVFFYLIWQIEKTVQIVLIVQILLIVRIVQVLFW